MRLRFSIYILVVTVCGLFACDTAPVGRYEQPIHAVQRPIGKAEPYVAPCTFGKDEVFAHPHRGIAPYDDPENYVPLRNLLRDRVMYAKARLLENYVPYPYTDSPRPWFDFVGVVLGCRASFRFETLLINFYTDLTPRLSRRSNRFDLNALDKAGGDDWVSFRAIVTAHNDDLIFGESHTMDLSRPNWLEIHDITETTITLSFSIYLIKTDPAAYFWSDPRFSYLLNVPYRYHFWTEPFTVPRDRSFGENRE